MPEFERGGDPATPAKTPTGPACVTLYQEQVHKWGHFA